MKFTFKNSLAVLTAIVLFYSACKKTDNNAINTDNYKALSSQIALNLVKSLSGNFGGANINDGIKAPSTMTSSHKGPVVFSTAASMCGYTIDTMYTVTKTVGDTAKTTAVNFNFVYTCNSDTVNGYTVYDSVKNVENGTKFLNTYIVAQKYYVKALDLTYKLVSMDGYINTSFTQTVPATQTVRATNHFISGQYYLQGLRVAITNGVADVQSGIAPFNMSTVDIDATTSATGNSAGYTGSIEFLGNHKAKLTLKISATASKVYMVDLITGTTTAA